MTAKKAPAADRRIKLSRDRVLEAAIALADEGGIERLTMRRLGEDLGVEAMSLYNHVSNKEDLLNGMIDALFAEIALPLGGADWKQPMPERALSLRDGLAAVAGPSASWNPGGIPGPRICAIMTVIGKRRSAGFDIAMVAYAYSLLDGYIHGSALTKMNMPLDTPPGWTPWRTTCSNRSLLANIPT